MNFKGIFTALITPFYQGELDTLSLKKLIQYQLKEGVDGFVINGTTGEAPTLREQEVSQIMEIAHAEITGQVPIILGVGHNNTEQALKNIQKSKQLKADAVLAITPYYNKPSQEGLKRHFQKLAHNSELPILLYNVPSRTQVHLQIPTILELSKNPLIRGIKEASGDLSFGEKLLSSNLPSSFVVTSGDDMTFLDLVQKGGQGVISVASHFLLKPMKESLQHVLKKEDSAIIKFKNMYGSIVECLFKESNPIMIKQVMYFKKLIRSPELRLPLCEPSHELSQTMQKLLKEKNLYL